MPIYTTHFYYPVTAEFEPNVLILISFSFFYICLICTHFFFLKPLSYLALLFHCFLPALVLT